jgi:hypothetical protein
MTQAQGSAVVALVSAVVAVVVTILGVCCSSKGLATNCQVTCSLMSSSMRAGTSERILNYLITARPRTWRASLRSLTSAAKQQLYDVSVMVLAASEDKTYRGAFIASPTMPWAWGTGLENPAGAPHR